MMEQFEKERRRMDNSIKEQSCVLPWVALATCCACFISPLMIHRVLLPWLLTPQIYDKVYNPDLY